MNKSISIIFLLSLMFTLIHSEDTTALTIGSGLDVNLKAGIFEHYLIDSNNRSSEASDLFIHISPKLADPFEVPYLTITSDKGYEQHCYNSHGQFAGICRIKAQDFATHQQFILVVNCLADCNLHIQTYFSPSVKLKVGSSIELAAFEDMGLTQIIQVEVPETEFTSLAIMALITNLEERFEFGEEGIDFYVNYGAGDAVEDPNEQKFALRGSSINGAGKGAFLYRDMVSPKDIIKSYVKLQKGVKVKFSVVALKGDEFGIQLGQSYYDYASKTSKKIYQLNTSLYSAQLANRTIEIVFDVYSGNPQFQLSFKQDFSSIIEYTRQSNAVSVIISPETRLKNQFSNNIYIRVMTNTTTEYYFSAQVIREDAIFLQPYITYFDQIERSQVQNYILFERYKFKEGSTIDKKNISFKIEILRGKGDFYFKRCPTLEYHAYNSPKIEHCFITNSSQLTSKEFLDEQIQNKHISSGNLLTIFMPFDITQCNNQSKAQGFITYICAFDIIALGLSSQQFEFSITAERKYLTNYLREGKIIKQYIPRQNYAYYVFSLPDIDKVEEINIFVSTFSGDAALMVSTTDKLPNLSSNMIKQAGAKCNIVLKKSDLQKQIYISVYAYQFTQINLGVIVHRSSSPGSAHQIPLEDGNTQSYILNQTQPMAFFIIKAKDSSDITVFINQISGNTQMAVLDENKKVVTCKNVPQDRLTCIFASEKNKNYSVRVEKKTAETKFTITYKTQSTNCLSGSLNSPIYVNIISQKNTCYTFNLNREINLEFASSFTHLQILDKQITTTLRINQKDYSVIGAHHTITLQDLNEVCEVGLKSGGFTKTCRVTINFQNKANVQNAFAFILQEQDVDVALFDGVSERVKGVNAESGVGKRFYYHVKSLKPILIFFSTQSLKSHYYLSGKFIGNTQFLLRNSTTGQDIYPPYIEYELRNHPQKIDKRPNQYTATLGKTGLEAISIDKDAIKEFCESTDCYLIISVYSESYQNRIEEDEDYYQIEVTQQETVLPLAESKVGVVNKGDIYTYVVQPQDGYVQLNYLSKQKCLIFEGAKFDGTIVKTSEFKKDLQVSKNDKIERIFVKGKEDGCSFEISYLSNSNPYRVVRLSHPYQIEIQKGQSQRFIYYHQNPRAFKIAPMISAGSIKVYIKPIKQQDFKLSQLSSLKLSDYPITSSYDGQFTVLQSDKEYCSNCYYYILIKSQTRFVGQVVFLRQYDPIPLGTNHVFKEHLVPLTVLGVQKYSYYSLTQFNVTFNMLSGKIQVSITDPSGFTVVVKDQISSKQLYSFKSMNYSEKEPVQLYSQRAKYTIQVDVIEQAEYYIEVKKQHKSQRLFQGLPATITFNKMTTQTVQFINSQDLDKPLNLMIDIREDQKNQAVLSFTFRGEKDNGQAIPGDKLLKNNVKSDNTYILSLLNFKGRYYVDIQSATTVSATLILVRNTLTHISPKQNYLFNDEGVYQIYSNQKNVIIEVFNCQGQVDLIGSKDERDMEQGFGGGSPIEIKRPNYGGHYVFNVQSQFASYFVKIRNKAKGTPIEYLVNYYYYYDVNPYDNIDADSYEVTYQNESSGIILTVVPPTLIDQNQNIKIKKITYTAYLSNDKVGLNRFSRCLIEGTTVKKSDLSPSIQIGEELISKVATGQKIYATVEASVQIQINNEDKVIAANAPQILTIFYQTIEVINEKTVTHITTEVDKTYTYWFTDSFILFIGWMALPFILSAASLYYILKCFARKLMMRQANMVEEVEIIASSQTVPTEQKIGEVPQSGTQIVKQHI